MPTIPCPRPALLATLLTALALAGCAPAPTADGTADGAAAEPARTFSFTLDATVPGTPAEVFDLATGDISGWWDHTMSGSPASLVIEPRPGGSFLERFDGSGDGVRHAVVTYARRGEMLRYEGPLGLAGHAVSLVTTWRFAAEGDARTTVTVEVHAAGEIDPSWPEVVERTFRHFLVERFVPYCEQRAAR
ncbi:MAG: hypothetical protein D6738_14410 [Acidobacteria bacterium]|nr:MAG: hypothetical protein D6738_14410 [Acidobacteriota bacterium]